MELLEQKLSRVDLNLLVSLSVLLKLRNVSRAAEQLYLSQSAMSRTLQRLRDLFDDPLFHRTASGITPTEKALEIEALLPDLLSKLANILTNQAFSPETCDKHFTLSMPPLMTHTFFLPFAQKIHQTAPKVRIAESSAKATPYQQLELGHLDFAIHIENPAVPAIQATAIGALSPVIIARKEHPLMSRKQVTLKDCVKYQFLELNVEENSYLGSHHPVDKLMRKQGLQRDVLLKSSQLSVVLGLLKASDTIMVVPEFLIKAKEFSQVFSSLNPFPKLKENNIELFLLEHKRIEHSEAHQWFKQQLIDALS